MDRTPLQLLAEYGQSPWLSASPRQLGSNGRFEQLVREHGIKGVTSDVLALQRSLSTGDAYDSEIARLLREGVDDPEAMLWMLAVRDARDSSDLMRPIWEASGRRDGFVSLAVDPRIAHDARRTLTAAKRLRALVARPNLLIGIPATAAGLAAIENAAAASISVDATLVGSVARYRRVAEAYMRGVERLLASGSDPARVASVASFSVSSLDAEVDRRLDALGGRAVRLKGRLGIANARLAYGYYREAIASERWRQLEVAGATRQRCLWEATSPGGRGRYDLLYVEELIGADTVSAMSVETIEAVEDHALLADKLERCAHEARAAFDEVEAAGVNLADVWRVVEFRALEELVHGFDRALDQLDARIHR